MVDVSAAVKAQVSAQIETYEGKAKKAAEDNLKHLADSTPTSKQAKETFEKYAQYAPKNIPTNFDEGVSWGEQALTNYAKAEGMKLADSEIKELASAYGLQGFVPDELPTNKKEAYVALTNIAGAGMAYATGVDPRICTVTVEALKDGKLGRNDVEAIGATAGAIGGAAVCQAFGIPAPIGAFFGGKFGAMIGETVSDVFGIGKSKEDLWIEHTKEVLRQLQKSAAEANAQCTELRHMYWDSFDRTAIGLEQKWEDMELRLGWRFGLRWFDQQWDGVPFTSVWDAQAKVYRPVNSLKSKTTYAQHTDFCRSEVTVSDSGTLRSKRCRYICAEPYGCPYPILATGGAPTSRALYGNAQRVVSAYAARGWKWLPPSARQYNCGFAAPHGAVTDLGYRAFWIEAINQTFAREQQKMMGLSQMTVRLAGDLAMTAAVVGMQKAVYDGKITAAKASTKQIVDESARKVAQARAASTAINNGALASGAGLLAYVWTL